MPKFAITLQRENRTVEQIIVVVEAPDEKFAYEWAEDKGLYHEEIEQSPDWCVCHHTDFSWDIQSVQPAEDGAELFPFSKED